MFGSRTSPMHVGHVAAAAALDVVGVDGPAAIAATVSSSSALSCSPSVWSATATSCASAKRSVWSMSSG